VTPVPPLPSIPSILLTEPVALDLVNTHFHLPDGPVDLLDQPEQRTEWLTAESARLGICATQAAARSEEVATALKAVREHVAAAIEPARHGKRPPARALSGLNEALRAAPAVPQARWDGGTVVTTTDRAGPLATRLAAGFAEAAVELFADPAIRKVRRCDAPSCVILFLPRNPNRRWCTPTICGNRARVARYYLRHKPKQADLSS
jgi:predicted RNA-binding Zn ribbon-like protein